MYYGVRSNIPQMHPVVLEYLNLHRNPKNDPVLEVNIPAPWFASGSYGGHNYYNLAMRNKLYLSLPIGSMYALFTHIYPNDDPNVGKHTIHGASGLCRGYIQTYGAYGGAW